MVEKANLPCLTQASTSSVDSTAMLPCSRERFYVELKPGETTFVSWKKLQKESQKTVSASGPNSSDAPAGAHPALEARIAPEVRPVKLFEFLIRRSPLKVTCLLGVIIMR